MKKLVLVAFILAGTTVAASAADMAPRYYKAPPPIVAPIYNWGGFYVGVNGGWGSSHNCYTNTAIFAVPVVHFGEGCHDATGGSVGGQVGYRWQAGNWVFGLEAQGNWADFSGSNASLVFAGLSNRTRIDAFGLFTGQVGYAWNNVLLYAKGGAAVVADRFQVNTFVGNVLAATTPDDTRWGGTVGAGVEFGFAPNWSVAAEYNHLFMQNRTYRFTDTFGFFFGTDRIRQDVDMGTLKVNYHFGGPIVAKY
jgi:outer membrane immunogenic protein